MTTSSQDIAQLILKAFSSPLEPEEKQMLDEWRSASAENERWYQQFQQPGFLPSQFERFMEAEAFSEGIVAPRVTASEHTSVAVVYRLHFIKKWGWAAAIILLFGAGAYLYTSNKTNGVVTAEKTPTPAQDILPGGNKATLTLADGTAIILDSAVNGNIAQQGNAAVIKLENGAIKYNLKGRGAGEIMMNTMSTPRGGQYQLILPDGTKVWLNAASSITYPAVFTGNDRKVKVRGEAYLEIAKDKHKPFFVDIDGRSSVQVLGTSFNINSYADEGIITTTLVDGSVKVNNTTMLQPGQQAIITLPSRPLRVINANIEQTLAWKNGLFNFNGLSLREVMHQLSRWYDIDIRFEGQEPSFRFLGEMHRNADLSKALKMLEKMEVKYRLEGKTLIVL